MQTETVPASQNKALSARSARNTARLFNIGNIISMAPGLILTPIIMLTQPSQITVIIFLILMMVPPILWFGVSMAIYTIARHHPNERVGYYTQHAAYRFYGMFGLVIPVGTFYGTDWELWVITGGVVGLVIIPWSLWDLYRIQKEDWQATQPESLSEAEQ